MHEISLLENMREILEEEALTKGFNKVSKITLEIGSLSCIEPEALRFGFAVVMKDTLAQTAELDIREVPGLGFCPKCKKQIEMENLYDPCSCCGLPLTEIIQGREMNIKELLVA